MRKKIQVRLNCGGCKKNFDTLNGLNKHIIKIGCHNGKKILKTELAIILGIKKYTVFIAS